MISFFLFMVLERYIFESSIYMYVTKLSCDLCCLANALSLTLCLALSLALTLTLTLIPSLSLSLSPSLSLSLSLTRKVFSKGAYIDYTAAGGIGGDVETVSCFVFV